MLNGSIQAIIDNKTPFNPSENCFIKTKDNGIKIRVVNIAMRSCKNTLPIPFTI